MTSPEPVPRPIACDEAGYTGNRLLDADQPYFAYGSVDLFSDEAAAIVAGIKARHHVQGGELKASRLLKHPRGRAIVAEILAAMEGRYLVTVAEKRLSLAGKFFEYVLEPVLQENNALFYDNGLHLFVANFLRMSMVALRVDTEDFAEQFERFMRKLDPAEAPAIFRDGPGDAPVFGALLRFAHGYRDVIAEETVHLKSTGATGKWVLDLTTTSVSSHLRHWGEIHPLIEVTCDDSKPLRALAGIYDVMVSRADAIYLDFRGKRRRITWNMSRPIAFASSDGNPAVQLADIAAGAAAAGLINVGDPDYAEIAEAVGRHAGEDCILPDLDLVDLKRDDVVANVLVLEELARRADLGADPLLGMEAFYALARREAAGFAATRRRAGRRWGGGSRRTRL